MTCEEKIMRSFYYRRTRMGGLSKTVVVVNNRVAMPTRERRSRSGTHGEDYYLLSESEWNKAILLHFSQSNRGHRDLVVESALQLPSELIERLKRLWTAGLTIDEIIRVLTRELKRMKAQTP